MGNDNNCQSTSVKSFIRTSVRRKRLAYLALAAIAVGLGLLSRSDWVPLPRFVATYSGDTIWAMMVFFLMGVLAPRQRTLNVAIAALLFSFGIEFLQFYHSPWIEAIRNTTLGALVLGFGFKASDLVCYTVGIAVGAAIDIVVLNKTAPAG
ncbi:MAG: DUF2809 domain-containing protein [Cyanobacteria bacterium P01_E01_bin.45]